MLAIATTAIIVAAILAEYRTILDRFDRFIDTELLFNIFLRSALKRHFNNFCPGLVRRVRMKVEDENDEKEADEVMFCRFSVGDLVQVIHSALLWLPAF